MSISTMNWAALENGIYVPILIVGWLLLAYRGIRWRRAIAFLSSSTHYKYLIINGSWFKQVTKLLLVACGLTFIFVALLRPQWDKKEIVVTQEGRDLFIALDISRSMLAQDCKPNRLSCAKQKIAALLKLLSCERVGLILFSGSTFVQCPLTSDYGAFHMFLNQIDVETISSGSTVLDQAIKQAIQSFKASPERKNKLLVIVTDGEDFSSNLSGIKQEAQAMGLKIFTVGIGTAQGAPIPVIDEQGKQAGHQLNKQGAVVISRLNEGILRALSAETGGIYTAMTQDDSDMKMVARAVQKFEKERFEDRRMEQYQEQYPYFIGVAFICLLIEWLL